MSVEPEFPLPGQLAAGFAEALVPVGCAGIARMFAFCGGALKTNIGLKRSLSDGAAGG